MHHNTEAAAKRPLKTIVEKRSCKKTMAVAV